MTKQIGRKVILQTAVEPATKRHKRHKEIGLNSLGVAWECFTRRVSLPRNVTFVLSLCFVPLVLFRGHSTAAFSRNDAEDFLTQRRKGAKTQKNGMRFHSGIGGTGWWVSAPHQRMEISLSQLCVLAALRLGVEFPPHGFGLALLGGFDTGWVGFAGVSGVAGPKVSTTRPTRRR